MDPLWSETCRSTFKYFIISIVSTYYILFISWIIKCLIITDARCENEDWYLGPSWKSVELRIWLKSDKNIGYLTWRPNYTFYCCQRHKFSEKPCLSNSQHFILFTVTHSIRTNTMYCCFSTETIVTRTSHNIALYVHGLSHFQCPVVSPQALAYATYTEMPNNKWRAVAATVAYDHLPLSQRICELWFLGSHSGVAERFNL